MPQLAKHGQLPMTIKAAIIGIFLLTFSSNHLGSTKSALEAFRAQRREVQGNREAFVACDVFKDPHLQGRNRGLKKGGNKQSAFQRVHY